MRDKLNRFVDNTNGQFIEVSYKEAIYQCMDLAYLWAFCLDIPKAAVQHQYAYQVYTEASDFTKKYFDILPNTPEFIPEAGDLVIWSNKYGPAGHIGIAIGDGNVDKFWVFEQNNPLGTNAHVQERSYSCVLGVLRPKVKPYDKEQLIKDAYYALVGRYPSSDEIAWRKQQDLNTVDLLSDLIKSDRGFYDNVIAPYIEDNNRLWNTKTETLKSDNATALSELTKNYQSQLASAKLLAVQQAKTTTLLYEILTRLLPNYKKPVEVEEKTDAGEGTTQ